MSPFWRLTVYAGGTQDGILTAVLKMRLAAVVGQCGL